MMEFNDELWEQCRNDKAPLFTYLMRSGLSEDEIEIVQTLEEYKEGNDVVLPTFIAYYLNHDDPQIKSICLYRDAEFEYWKS